jgi:hypothetical protein
MIVLFFVAILTDVRKNLDVVLTSTSFMNNEFDYFFM